MRKRPAWLDQGGMVWTGALLLFLLYSACQKDQEVPVVKLQDGKPVLVLPVRMKEFIEGYFEDYRLPGPQDMIGDWAQFKKTVPYAAWGDFNGDRLLDLALVLLGKDRWRLAELHQTADVPSRRWTSKARFRARNCSPETTILRITMCSLCRLARSSSLKRSRSKPASMRMIVWLSSAFGLPKVGCSAVGIRTQVFTRRCASTTLQTDGLSSPQILTLRIFVDSLESKTA